MVGCHFHQLSVHIGHAVDLLNNIKVYEKYGVGVWRCKL